MNHHRVAITGMGVVSALGNSLDTYWDNLVNGRSGIRKISLFDASDLPCQIAGEIPDFDPLQYLDRKTARRVPRFTQIAVAAARHAVQDSKLPVPFQNPERAGVYIGTALAGVDQIAEADQIIRTKGFRGLTPHLLPSGIPNMPAFQIAQEYQCLGPNNTTATACAAGTQAIGEAAEWIRRGITDVVIAGGAEAIVLELVVAAFSAMRALPVNYNDRPEAASRPFDIAREGFILSEGAAFVVLENLDHALARQAHIYAEVVGFASSSDGYDMIALHPDGLGPARAIRWALQEAGIRPDQVDYINAHGTSTPLNDKTETLAIKQVFGDSAYKVAISSTKSMLGHAMGASGSLEAIACALAIQHQMIPPTINYEQPDAECDLNYTPNNFAKREIRVTLSNSFGLGGQNACLVLKQFNK